ncbi:hypothetical protein AB0B10_28245 [Micromonospora arborensis]|uniref:hypothetical protein n=1 Tax=Micromonospora arborensis TaxID=2116518 RepID=UPI0033C4774E
MTEPGAPSDPTLRRALDEGAATLPLSLSYNEMADASAFQQLAQQVAATVDRREFGGEFGEYRFHLLGICTAAQFRSRAVATVRRVGHLRYRCATAAEAALGSHYMSG